MPFVLDSSTALAAVLPDEQNPLAMSLLRRLEDDNGVVPAIWPLEVMNGVLTAARRRRIKERDVTIVIEALLALPVHPEPTADPAVLRAIAKIAASHDLTSYDAAYLECALRHRIALATLDRRLLSAAEREGIVALK